MVTTMRMRLASELLFGALLVLAVERANASECSKPIVAQFPEFGAKVDKVLDAAVASGFAGGVAIVRKGKLIYVRVDGYSDNARQVRVTDATMFHVASITKYLTAVLILKAAEVGKLALGDPIAKFVPELALGKRGITIADLLAHRSGLGSSYAAEATSEPIAALHAIDAVPYDETKRGSFHYSNDGYDILAIIIERVFGVAYEEAARSGVFAPACLENSGFWGQAALDDPHVVGQPVVAVSPELKRRNYGMIGSAGFLTTAADLVRLQSALASGRVLRSASLAELWSARGTASIGQVAYGIFLVEHSALGPTVSARGSEDWGDNAILNHYRRDDVIVAVTTSKGPREGTGDLFRNTISKGIEAVLSAERGP